MQPRDILHDFCMHHTRTMDVCCRNQVSWMHVFTGAMLESVGVDVCSLQEAQMFKNRVQLELMLTSLLDRVSQEGIESDPKVATALYLLRLIADFARSVEVRSNSGQIQVPGQLRSGQIRVKFRCQVS